METQTPTRRTLLVPALFALATLMLASYIWISFGGGVPFAPAGYRISALFPQASNLYGNADVRISGINVGRVRSVTREGGEALVTMQLSPEYAPLHMGARAILRTKTLLGEAYIDLSPGSSGAPAIPDGGTLPAGNVVAAQQLSDVLSTFNPRTRSQLQSLIGGFASALRGRDQDLNDSLGWAGPAMVNFGSLLGALDAQRTDLGSLIGGAGQVLTAVGDRAGALQAAVTAGDQVLGVTAARGRALQQTIDALPGFLDQLRATAAAAGAASGDLSSAVSSVEPAAPLVAPALSAGASLARQLTPLFRAVPGLVAAARRGLAAGTAVLAAARPAVAQVFGAVQQLLPVLQLAAVVRNSIVAAFANVASTGEGSLPGPDGFDPHYLAAITLEWNEALGGYEKRLPSNRQNPYPAPNSELDIAHGGLKAYDCRNINNPDIVPPINGGAPPCVTQGPWTFDGVSAYFPRLQAAKP
jgi:phospholipid/cholesterol/gamma-HCH transport system substrate-binding protein